MKKILRKKIFVFNFILCYLLAGFMAYSAPAQAAESEYSFEESLKKFPSSYHAALEKLHEAYPKWQFEPLETGLKWNAVLEAEMEDDKNVVPTGADYTLKSKAADDYNVETDTFVQKDSGWVKAAAPTVAYFMDPRNFLDEKYIFQFEKLSYDETHTVEGVEAILKDTFMENTKISYLDKDGKTIDTDEKYSEVILEAAKEANIGAYYIASKIRQEIGATPSGSVSGQHKGYEGYYNFYNIGATDGEGAIGRGLSWARDGSTYGRPWDSPRKSIIGGAKYISSSYIGPGQSTGYLQKFNVNPNSAYKLYSHQYMTNVAGATSEAVFAYNGYVGMGLLEETKLFWIPVYKSIIAKGKTVEFAKTALSGTVSGDGINVRKGAGTTYDKLGVTVSSGQKVTIEKKVRNKSIYSSSFFTYPYWYKVSFNLNGQSYSGYIAEKFVTPAQQVEKVVGQKFTPEYSVKKKNGQVSTGKVYFDSSDCKVASISDSGEITALKSGTTIIRAFLTNGNMDSFTLKVVAADATPAPGATYDPKEEKTPQPTATAKPDDGTVSKLKKPTGVSAKAKGKKKVRLKWKNVKGASKYRILRSTKKKKGFKTLVTLKKKAVWKAQKKSNIYVASAKKGVRYYYKVVAIGKLKSGKMGRSPASKVVSAKAK